MESVIKDIVTRTNGELYIGVVGSVRTGKSTFINKFIEVKVLPFLDNEMFGKVQDELPQCSEGKEIMTVEPKFIPNNSINLELEDGLQMAVRLVDCVGYIIPESKGYINKDGKVRMVKTPWFEEEIPFTEAAEIGTKKVMKNHSNIGVVVTTDGSFGDFTRENYIETENKIIEEMKEQEKPFVVVVNSSVPNSRETLKICSDLEEKHDVKVISIDVYNMGEREIDTILRSALYEFEIKDLDINTPTWISALEGDNKYKIQFNEAISVINDDFVQFKHIEKIAAELQENEMFEEVTVTKVEAGLGHAEITIKCVDSLYNEILRELLGCEINTRGEFITLLQQFQKAKTQYDEYSVAIEEVKVKGYGISLPAITDMKLEVPEIVKHAGRYGVKLKAIAPSIHMIKVDVESTFEPIIGTESQSKELINNLMKEEDNIWESKIFGRTLNEVVNDGIKAKLNQLPSNTQLKLRDTLEKLVNKGKSGIIAIIL